MSNSQRPPRPYPGQQLARFFREQRPVGGRVNDHWFELLAQYAAFGVNLVDGHQRHILQRRFRNRHGAGEGGHNPHFDGVCGVGLQGKAQAQKGGRQGKCFQ